MAYRVGNRTNSRGKSRKAVPSQATYERAFEPSFKPSPFDRNVKIDPPLKVLGEMEIPESGYFIDHENPTDNIIVREVPNVLFDHSDVEDKDSSEIYELLPPVPTFPDTPPQSLNLYVANWSRVHNFGGVTDSTKDPRIDDVEDWSIAEWTTRHRWPQEATLDPTYVFFTQDPALFYTQQVISHYEPDDDGNIQAVMVPDEDIVWSLDGKEVHRGWFMDLSALSRTVQVVQGTAAIVPRLLSCTATNSEGELRKEIKFAAIDSDDGGLIGGSDQIDNFSSTFEGQFIADDDDNSDNYRSAIFWPDPRYGPRDIYVRFMFDGFGKGKSSRRKFRKNKATFRLDGKTVWSMSARQVQDKWTRKDKKAKRHQDAKRAFPAIFNDNGRIKKRYRDAGGGLLDEIGVTDWTEGRKSALFYDEINRGNNYLIKFSKKPGPFDLFLGVSFRVRKGGWFSKKHTRYWEKTLTYDNEELNLDTPLQPIDLGVVKIGYRHR